MRRFRLIRWLAGTALAAGALLGSAGAFSDTAGHWAEPAINKWSQEYGIIQGYEDGTFRPDNSITRGAFAGILDRFMHFQAIAPEETFSDLRGSYWKDEILKLNASGVYLGNNGRALANSSITRQQAVTMIARAFQVTGESVDLPYTDAERIEAYAQPAVAEMTARGWLNDAVDGAFRPTDPITRAEIVNIFGSMIQELMQSPEVRNWDVAGTLMISASDGAVLESMTVAGDLILAPGVTGAVTLRDVTLNGVLRNLSTVEPTVISTDPEEEEPQEPQPPAIVPADIYTPSGTTGAMIDYSGRQIPVCEGRERSRLYEGDFIWSGDRLEYIGSDFYTRFGIDVSAYQNRASENKTIDWQAVRNDGVPWSASDSGAPPAAPSTPTSIMPRILTAPWPQALRPACTSSRRPLPWRRPLRRRILSSICCGTTRSTALWPMTGRCMTPATGSTAQRRRWPRPAPSHFANGWRRRAIRP